MHTRVGRLAAPKSADDIEKALIIRDRYVRRLELVTPGLAWLLQGSRERRDLRPIVGQWRVRDGEKRSTGPIRGPVEAGSMSEVRGKCTLALRRLESVDGGMIGNLGEIDGSQGTDGCCRSLGQNTCSSRTNAERLVAPFRVKNIISRSSSSIEFVKELCDCR